MKKILFFAALMLGMVSCQTGPEGLDVIVGGEQEVMLNVSLPESTRSASSTGFDFTDFENNGKYDLRFILEIAYNETVVRTVKTSKTTSATFPVRLAPGRNYTFTVWADLVNEGSQADLYYNILSQNKANNESVLENIMINIDEWTPNVEARDAYTYTDTFKFGENPEKLKMKLTRPFAKVRVVSTDIAEVRKFDIEPKSATVAYNTVLYTAFNAVEGTVVTTETVANKSHSFAYEDVNTYDEAEGQFTVFTDYIFVPENGTVQFNLNVYADETHGGLIKENSFNTAIPVETNKVTSIVGDVLTEGGNVSITVDSEHGEKETINFVDTAESLQEAINAIEDNKSGNITLGGDINLDDLLGAGILATRAEKQYGLLIPAGKSVVLDLNGNRIFQTKECTANYAMIVNKGNLTITDNSVAKNGSISFKDTGAGDPTFGWGSYTLRNEGTLVVENGTIEHLGEQDAHMICAIFQYSGSSIINGGTISTPAYRSARLWSGDMTINGGTFEGQLWLQAVDSTSNLTINGGTFAPRGGDSSSVFVTNNQYNVAFAVTGGYFTTKIGMSKPFGCITGGEFTTAAKENTNASLVHSDYQFVEGKNGTWVVSMKPAVAKIGEVEYTSLNKAVAAVKDGETITLVADELFTENNYFDNGGWKDGLGYAGDQSFTIDLGGYTVSQNGALNDYLLWFKNAGSKANTITIKNGTLDAGTTAYCALCTASSHDNLLTINLEDVTLINNISNGSTVKVRAGSVVNVKAGTKIIGKNSYLGIENWKATVNIYDGAEIYMNGTSSYNGCLVGVGGNGTTNVYGGYGKGVKGGFIAMTSGGTINVSGGEWIANTDGTVGDNSNLYILTAQSNKYESGFAGPSIINVTGGTLRGGMDAWVLNNIEGEKAELNISGGNFNVDPTRWLADYYSANKNEDNTWTVAISEENKLRKVLAEGGKITLNEDITIADKLVVTATTAIEVDGNDKTITYTGSGASARAIDVPSSTEGANVTLKNLTIDCTSDYCQRGLNYNTNGNFVLDNVTVKGKNVTYAINLPGSAIGANVTINNSSLTGNIALNVWGKNAKVTANNSNFTSVDNATHENYSAIALNNDGTTIADGAVITINGGTITALDENNNPSNACRNATNTGIITISDSTEVIGSYTSPVAIVTYGGNEFYSCDTLQRAINKAVETNAVAVRLIKNVEVTEPVTIPANSTVTIELNGHNIINTTASETFGEGEGIIAYGKLTIKGEGTVQASTMAVWARGNNGAEVNIYGGTFKGCAEGYAKGGRSVVYASSGNTINIYDGTFQALAADKTSYADKTNGVYAALNIADNNGYINVYGGSFYKQNPAAPGTEPKAWNETHPNGFVAEGYGAVLDGDLYNVVKGNFGNSEVVDQL